MEVTMKKLFSVVLVVLLFSQLFAVSASASEGQPAGRCAPAFEIHPFMEHSGDPIHHHIGVDQDLNGDGFICMKMLNPDLHLHVDNSIPLR